MKDNESGIAGQAGFNRREETFARGFPAVKPPMNRWRGAELSGYSAAARRAIALMPLSNDNCANCKGRLTMHPASSAVPILIMATIGGFLLELGAGDAMFEYFALWPLQAGFLPWQVLSYAFLHASIAHLAFNMFGLWLFGREMENMLGRQTFLQLYFASILSAAGVQLLTTALSGDAYPTVGASGGVFGLLLASAICFPHRIIVLLFPPLPLPMWLFVTLYAGLELFLGVTGTQAGVAHFAHLGGMVGGYLVIRRRLRRDR